MKLIVFGGTGQTGLEVLRQSTQAVGIEVTAFVRTPSKIPEDIRRKLRVVRGDVLDEDSVAEAMKGHDAVISCLGTGWYLGATTLISQGTINIVDGMRKHGTRKLAVVSISFLLPRHWVPFILKKTTDDHRRALEYLKKSKDIDWAAVMSPEIIQLSIEGPFKTAINKLPGANVATTHDIAEWMISTVRDDIEMREYAHQMVGISSTMSHISWLTRSFQGRMTLMTLGIVFIALAVYTNMFT